MTDTIQFTAEQLDVIRARAYEKFLSRGSEDGHDLEDWLSAEQEVLATTGDRTAEKTASKPRKSKAAA